jgi:hypothetical protein
MRENRPYGSEGGVVMSHPYPYRTISMFQYVAHPRLLSFVRPPRSAASGLDPPLPACEVAGRW